MVMRKLTKEENDLCNRGIRNQKLIVCGFKRDIELLKKKSEWMGVVLDYEIQKLLVESKKGSEEYQEYIDDMSKYHYSNREHIIDGKCGQIDERLRSIDMGITQRQDVIKELEKQIKNGVVVKEKQNVVE